MRFKLKCGCKGVLNKRKKILTISYICETHMKEIIARANHMLWYGFPDSTPSRKPFGKSPLTPKILKQYKEFMAPYETLTVSPQTLFWLRWLEEQRGKPLNLKLTFNDKTYPIIATVSDNETRK
jgi:hypothetical protein